jgi:hypothetical protein
MNYTPTGNPIAQTRGTSALIRNEFALVQAAVNSKLDSSNPSLTDGTANTQPFGDASTKIANTAFVAATAFSSALPAQTGNSGKFVTTDGTSASWAALPTLIGTGGQTTTGNITLTSNSASAITVTPANPGLYVTLPDATTCTKGTASYCVYNAGDYDYGVKDNAGTQLGWVRARTGAMIGLSDSSTAAGVWAYYGLEKTAITAQLALPSVASANMGNSRTIFPVMVTLDATRTCILFGGATCYAVVYDSSSQTWGSVVTVRTGMPSFMTGAILSATNQVLVTTCASTNVVQAVTLTVSGTAITVNTPVTLGTGASWQGAMSVLVAVGSSFVCAYSKSGATQEAFAITVSGTVPTLGSAVSNASAGTSGSGYIRAYVSGSVVRVVTSDYTVGVWCSPFTVSGTTLTLGTSAGAATGGMADSYSKALQNGAGDIVVAYPIGSPGTATDYGLAIFKLTGTTETVSTVSMGCTAGSVRVEAHMFVELVNVGTTKTLAIVYDNSVHRVHLLTDTSGTASVGTALTLTIQTAAAASHGLSVTGTTAKCLLSGAVSNGNAGLADLILYDFDCSGTSPTVSSFKTMSGFPVSGGSVTLGYAQIGTTNYRGQRHTGMLKAGSSAYFIAGPCAAFDWQITANSFRKMVSLPISNSNFFIQDAIVSGVIGAASNESWVYAALGLGSNQVTIQRIEAAQ